MAGLTRNSAKDATVVLVGVHEEWVAALLNLERFSLAPSEHPAAEIWSSVL
jgi:hypothetical protein